MDLVLYFNFYTEDQPSRHVSFYATNIIFDSGNLEEHLATHWEEMEQIYGPHPISKWDSRSSLNVIGYDFDDIENQVHQNQLINSWRDMLASASPECRVGNAASFSSHDTLTDVQIFEHTKRAYEQLHDTSARQKSW